MRVMEWDDSRARYPNIWHEGMPRHVLAFDRLAARLRLGDLIAVYYPTSQRHPERSERYLGLSRVSGLRVAETPGFAWLDLTTAHRFDPPLRLEGQPRRVFLCCDPGWPDNEVRLFDEVWQAAIRGGFEPEADDLESPDATSAPAPPSQPATADDERPTPDDPAEATRAEPRSGAEAPAAAEPPMPSPAPRGRLFAGVDYSGDMRDPREATWLSIVELHDDALRVVRLDPTGRHGLESYLRDPDSAMMNVEAIGLDFPFSLPVPFAEKLMGEKFPEEGWWALARRMERLSRPQYLVAIQEFRESHGESKRHTDEHAQAFSPLHRVNPDLGPMTFHGIRMIAEDRSRYAIKPFESAKGRLLLEVYPGGFVKRLALPSSSGGNGKTRRRAIIDALGRLDFLPCRLDPRAAKKCLDRRDALDAVIAARQAAVAVVTGEVDRTPEELAPEAADRVRHEGWIYGLQEPA
jgi:hypothetical protein